MNEAHIILKRMHTSLNEKHAQFEIDSSITDMYHWNL